MKRKKFLTLLISILLPVISYPVFAATCGGVDTSLIECDNSGAGAIRSVLVDVINIASIGIGIVAVIGITIAGIQYLTAGSNVDQATKSKRRVYEIIIGLFVYVLMWAGTQWLLPGGIFTQGVEVTGVSLGVSNVNLTVGDTKTFNPVLTPLDADNESFTWESSNANVATVDDEGKIVAKSEGIATISVKTSNGTTTQTTIKVQKPAATPSPSDNTNTGTDSSEDGPSTSDRLRIGGALAVMHAANNGDLAKVRKAVAKKYYAVECDLQIKGNTLVCYHDGYSSNVTFNETMTIAKNGGAKVVLDMKDRISSNQALSLLAQAITKDNLANWVIIQTGSGNNADRNLNGMKKLNSLVGKKLEYWCLTGGISPLIANAAALKAEGMTGANVSTDTYGVSGIEKAKKAGFEVGTWTYTTSVDKIKNWHNHGLDYVMVHYIDKF